MTIVTCVTPIGVIVAVTGSLTQLATAPAADGHWLANALALKSTRPIGSPLRFKTDIDPGLTLKSNCTVRVAAATTCRHPTPGGTCVTPCALRRFRPAEAPRSSMRGP